MSSLHRSLWMRGSGIRQGDQVGAPPEGSGWPLGGRYETGIKMARGAATEEAASEERITGVAKTKPRSQTRSR
jgi:hypothetical protein